jgi:hypothetical protein
MFTTLGCPDPAPVQLRVICSFLLTRTKEYSYKTFNFANSAAVLFELKPAMTLVFRA